MVRSSVRKAVVWQVVGGFVALLVIAAAIGELIWCSLYFSDPTNVSQPFTGIVHGSAATASFALFAYYSRRRERDAAIHAAGSAALLETHCLQFRLGPWSIQVQWMFPLMAMVAALWTNDLTRILPFLFIATAAVLAHEVGHAAAAQVIRASKIRIELNLFGGLTTFEGVWPTRAQQIAISFAGPAAGTLLGLFVAALARVTPILHEQAFYPDILLATFGWSALNLLPILPMDGASIVDAAFRGKLNTLAVSLSTALAGMLACALTHHLDLILIFVILLIANLFAVPAISSAVRRMDARLG